MIFNICDMPFTAKNLCVFLTWASIIFCSSFWLCLVNKLGFYVAQQVGFFRISGIRHTHVFVALVPEVLKLYIIHKLQVRARKSVSWHQRGQYSSQKTQQVITWALLQMYPKWWDLLPSVNKPVHPILTRKEGFYDTDTYRCSFHTAFVKGDKLSFLGMLSPRLLAFLFRVSYHIEIPVLKLRLRFLRWVEWYAIDPRNKKNVLSRTPLPLGSLSKRVLCVL